MDENQKLIQQLVGAMIQYQPTGANAVSNVASGAQTQPAAQPTVNPNLFPATPQVAQGMDLGFGSKPPAQSGGAQPTTPTNFPQATPQPAAPSPVVNHFAEAQKFLPNTGANGGVISQLGGQQGNVTPQMPAAPNFVQQLSVPTPQAQAAPVPAAVQTPAAVGTAPTPQSAPQAPADPYAGTLASKSWDKFYRGMTGNSYGDIQAQKQVAANNRENAMQQQADRIKAALGVQRDVGMAQAKAASEGAAIKYNAPVEAQRIKAEASRDNTATMADTRRAIADDQLKAQQDALGVKKMGIEATQKTKEADRSAANQRSEAQLSSKDRQAKLADLTRQRAAIYKNIYDKPTAEQQSMLNKLDEQENALKSAAQTSAKQPTPSDVLAQVKAGKMTKEQAQAIAKQYGWN